MLCEKTEDCFSFVVYAKDYVNRPLYTNSCKLYKAGKCTAEYTLSRSKCYFRAGYTPPSTEADKCTHKVTAALFKTKVDVCKAISGKDPCLANLDCTWNTKKCDSALVDADVQFATPVVKDYDSNGGNHMISDGMKSIFKNVKKDYCPLK